jgi:hypothetical protein
MEDTIPWTQSDSGNQKCPSRVLMTLLGAGSGGSLPRSGVPYSCLQAGQLLQPPLLVFLRYPGPFSPLLGPRDVQPPTTGTSEDLVNLHFEDSPTSIHPFSSYSPPSSSLNTLLPFSRSGRQLELRQGENLRCPRSLQTLIKRKFIRSMVVWLQDRINPIG